MASVLNTRSIDQARYAAIRKDDYYLHVSDIMKVNNTHEFCPRQYVLSYLQDPGQNIRQLTPGQELLFATGHALHDLARNKFMQNSPYGKFAYGEWRCTCGACIVKGLRPKATVCTVCDTPVSIYEELTVLDQEHRIVGHPDFLLYIDGVFHIYEIKSIDRKSISFEDLKHPLGDHVLQATFYYWLLKRAGLRVSRTLRIVYADRNLKKMFGGVVYKEFVQMASDEVRLQPFYDKAQEVRAALTKNLYPHRICENSTCTRAKNCAQVVSCFSREAKGYVDRRN